VASRTTKKLSTSIKFVDVQHSHKKFLSSLYLKCLTLGWLADHIMPILTTPVANNLVIADFGGMQTLISRPSCSHLDLTAATACFLYAISDSLLLTVKQCSKRRVLWPKLMTLGYWESDATSTSLASLSAGNRLKAGGDDLQFPARSDPDLHNWHVHCRFVRRREVAAAIFIHCVLQAVSLFVCGEFAGY